MNSFKNKYIEFIEKYLIFILFGFGVLTLFPYITAFKGLEANNNAGIIYRGIVAGLLIILFVIGLICYRKIPNKWIILGSILYLTTQLITIFASPLIKQIEVPVLQQIVGTGMIFTNIMTVFVACYLLNDHQINIESLNIACYFLLGIGVAVCLYTYIFQYKEIGSVLSDEHGWNYQVTSIFTTKGVYGFVLLICSIFTVILALNTKKYWMYAFPTFFLFNSFLCRSKTSILCILIILIYLLIYHFSTGWKTHQKQWKIALTISAGIILILCLFTFIPLLCFGPFKTLNHFFTQTIFNDGITVTKDRIEKVSVIIKAVDYPLGIMFGCGERITNYIIAPASAEIRGDNMYATNYATGGIIKFILYIAFAVYAIYKIDKKKGEHRSLSILFIIVILLTGLFDDNSILGINLCFLFLAPVLYSIPFKQEN